MKPEDKNELGGDPSASDSAADRHLPCCHGARHCRVTGHAAIDYSRRKGSEKEDREKEREREREKIRENK